VEKFTASTANQVEGEEKQLGEEESEEVKMELQVRKQSLTNYQRNFTFFFQFSVSEIPN
jgi:hypothetical protein